MTQSSLIARLRKVEEALTDSRRYVSCEGSDDEFRFHDAALTDLRELIKEVEGQESGVNTIHEKLWGEKP